MSKMYTCSKCGEQVSIDDNLRAYLITGINGSYYGYDRLCNDCFHIVASENCQVKIINNELPIGKSPTTYEEAFKLMYDEYPERKNVIENDSKEMPTVKESITHEEAFKLTFGEDISIEYFKEKNIMEDSFYIKLGKEITSTVLDNFPPDFIWNYMMKNHLNFMINKIKVIVNNE